MRGRELPELMLGKLAIAVAAVVTGFVVADAIRDVKRRRNSTEVSDYGVNDTTAREKDVVAVVTVTFAVS